MVPLLGGFDGRKVGHEGRFSVDLAQRGGPRPGLLKIGKALGIGTSTVQRVPMEQPRPFDVDVAEAAFASQ